MYFKQTRFVKPSSFFLVNKPGPIKNISSKNSRALCGVFIVGSKHGILFNSIIAPDQAAQTEESFRKFHNSVEKSRAIVLTISL